MRWLQWLLLGTRPARQPDLTIADTERLQHLGYHVAAWQDSWRAYNHNGWQSTGHSTEIAAWVACRANEQEI